MVFCLNGAISGVFKLGPRMNVALWYVAVLVLGINLLLRQDPVPQVEFSQLAWSKGVTALELASHFVLILSEHNSSSMQNHMAFQHVCGTVC